MDAQYPFASRDDIWRVFDELKELHIAQYEQGERLAQLERRRDDDARLRSPWCPVSPFPHSVGTIAPGSPPLPSSISSPFTKTSLPDPTFHSPPDAFKGFDQAHHSAMTSSAVGFESEDEPRRGASRANSVRFDESAIHGNAQASRSSNDLPLRTGSGLSTHPLLERTFSHQSDGRLSSSGHSLHSTRTNSLRLNTTRLLGTTPIESPLIPPPGLFLLGPVPSIIRCWLTNNFTNGSLLYAAVCSGSYVSTLGLSMIRNLGMENMIVRDCDAQYIKLPLYLPEALIHPSSSRPGTPTHQVPALTVRFVVRETEVSDNIQIIIGSDVMRAHNADILFSQDKLIMVDDDHNRVSVPLVRPEKDSVFKSLCTSSSTPNSGDILGPPTHANPSVGIIGRPANVQQKPASAPPSTRLPGSENTDHHKSNLQNVQPHAHISAETRPPPATPATSEPTKTEDVPSWGGPWRRDAMKSTSTTKKPADKREMKVFRTGKSASHANPTTSASAPSSATTEKGDRSSLPLTPSTQHGTPNPVGGASAFGWLNPPHHHTSS
ncbi:hypothetical protein PCG10_009003 [Penicillium crustosum]|uniref:Ubiquitin carboxyl-terminal hydrolase 19 n=1 Tax=Penicillium crustosum TaxID=36656 RepID=A0A9P5GI18_PENCR|nr:uncharacterized protein N7487_006122 [Penicillium crustosum]KAF7520651.1 hypothetical protein PCG10_009003 [Penicillium crustosum]KAJ5411763.1 hypothetical protein N7487_006122 [Penicillium crustosum]